MTNDGPRGRSRRAGAILEHVSLPEAVGRALRHRILNNELPAPLPVRAAFAALSRLDGFEPTPTDREDVMRPYLQFLGP